MPHLLSNDICIEFSSRCLANAEFCLKVAPLFYFDLSFGSRQQVEEPQIGFTPDVMLEI